MTQTNTKIIGYTAAIISTILMGSMGIFVRNIEANGRIITFARLFVGLLFLTFFLFLKKEGRSIILPRFSPYFLLSGIVMSLGILCYINAINNTSLSKAVFLLYLAPLIAVGIAAIFLNEKFTFLNGLLLCLAFLGFIFLLELNITFNIDELSGYLWGICAAILYALYIVCNRKITENIPAFTRTFYQFLFGSLTMVPFLINDSLMRLKAIDIYWLIAVGFFQGFLALSLLILAIKYLRTFEYSTISYIEPLVASLIGFILYSESLTVFQIMGCVIIFSGGMIQIVATRYS